MPIEKTDGEEKLKRHQPCNQPKVTDRSNEIYFLDHSDGGEARDKQDERYKSHGPCSTVMIPKVRSEFIQKSSFFI